MIVQTQMENAMQARDIANLVLLAALWGVSFVFVRVAAPEFGAIPLIELRVALASLVLLPIVFARRGFNEIRQHWRPIAVMGVLHYAAPFTLFAWAMLTMTGGHAAIINASAPLFAGAVSMLWLRERLPGIRILGLVAGFVGVVVLVQGQAGVGAVAEALPIAAALIASSCYGFAAVLARRHLTGVDPTSVSAGSMAVAAIAMP